MENEEESWIDLPIMFLGHKMGMAYGVFPDEEVDKVMKQYCTKPTNLQNILFNFLCIFSKGFRKIRKREMERWKRMEHEQVRSAE